MEGRNAHQQQAYISFISYAPSPPLPDATRHHSNIMPSPPPPLHLFFSLQLLIILGSIEAKPPLLLPTSVLVQSHANEKWVKEKEGKVVYETRFFSQELDHFTFTPQSYNKFDQKYLINSQFWDKGPVHSAPIFVYAGNEGDIEWFASNTGFMADIAPKFRALLLFIEHRFYGESLPFGKKSNFTAEELGYLSTAQALADYAILIRDLKQNLSAEASPVVMFGGSYGGMLAAWFRLKYPHIAIGALASSAPILNLDNITPSSAFYDAVSQDFKDESSGCFETIKGSWAKLMAMSNQKHGLDKLSKAFKSCKPIRSVYFARNWLWEAFVYTAMVDYPVEANFMKQLPAYPVREMCRIIDGFPAGRSKLSKAIAAARLYHGYKKNLTCFEIENEKDEHGLSGWGWQACTEMVIPMSTSNESMFPPYKYDFEETEKQCKSRYGVNPRPHWITTEYGGHKIELVLKRFGSNIIFSNGLRDPWSRGGVLTNISDSIVALVTKEGAHHVDLRSKDKDDPEWLVEQRKKEVDIIQKWLDQYYCDSRSQE